MTGGCKFKQIPRSDKTIAPATATYCKRGIVDYGFVRVCDAHDPDGNRVWLVQVAE